MCIMSFASASLLQIKYFLFTKMWSSCFSAHLGVMYVNGVSSVFCMVEVDEESIFKFLVVFRVFLAWLTCS